MLLPSSRSRCPKQFQLAHCGQRKAHPGLELCDGVRSTNTPCSRTLVACYLSFLCVVLLSHLSLLCSSCLTLFFLSRFLPRRLTFTVSGRHVTKNFVALTALRAPRLQVKVKVSQEQATKDQRGSRDTALLFL